MGVVITGFIKKYKIFFFPFLLLLVTQNAFSQLEKTAYPDSLVKKRLFTTIGVSTGGYILGMGVLFNVWYKDKERVAFHLYDDSKHYLQMDKLGHSYATYYQNSVFYHSFRWSGVDRKKSLIYSSAISFALQLHIELFDGLYKGWGWSWSDILANTAGMSLFTFQELFFEEQIVRMKFSYFESKYAKTHYFLGRTSFEHFFYDYNGHTYWLSASIARIIGSNTLPKWLNIALGYSANGVIDAYQNPTYYMGKPFPHFERYRQIFLSLDIDFSKIPTRSKFLKAVFKGLNMIKIPFPALEWNRIDKMKFHWLYF